MNISRTLITEHNAHGKSDQEIVLCEKKLEMYSPSRRVVTTAAESKRGRSQLSIFMKAYREYARGEGVWDNCTVFHRKSTFIFNH